MVEPDVSVDFSFDTLGNITAITVQAPAGSIEAKFCEEFCTGLEHHQAFPSLKPEGLFFFNEEFPDLKSVSVWISEENRKKILEFFDRERQYICLTFDHSFVITSKERGYQLQFDPVEA